MPDAFQNTGLCSFLCRHYPPRPIHHCWSRKKCRFPLRRLPAASATAPAFFCSRHNSVCHIPPNQAGICLFSLSHHHASIHSSRQLSEFRERRNGDKSTPIPYFLLGTLPNIVPQQRGSPRFLSHQTDVGLKRAEEGKVVYI